MSVFIPSFPEDPPATSPHSEGERERERERQRERERERAGGSRAHSLTLTLSVSLTFIVSHFHSLSVSLSFSFSLSLRRHFIVSYGERHTEGQREAVVSRGYDTIQYDAARVSVLRV